MYGSSQDTARGDACEKVNYVWVTSGKRLSPAPQILSVDEGSSHEAIVDIRAMFTLWKDYSVSPSLITEQILLFANPVFPERLGVRVDDEATST